MRTRILASTILLGVFASLASCVEHRPLRTEVFDENTYFPKEFLTRESPHKKGTGDNTWLFKSTVVKTPVPLAGADFYTGYPGPTKYVRFQFANNQLQMMDATEYSPPVQDKDGKLVPPQALANVALNAWPGTHVDIQMKMNLDGERTNVIEENKERPWEQRQHFKVELDKGTEPDVNMIGWYVSDYLIGDCMKLRSVALVPNSVEMECVAGDPGCPCTEQNKAYCKAGSDDYMSWTIAVTYEFAVFGGGYYCGDIWTSAADRSNFTFHIKYSLWRVPKREYKAKEVAEKDPVRQTVSLLETPPRAYYDTKTGLWGAKTYLMRFDPQKTHTFYFGESFPEAYKAHFRDGVAKQFNDLMAAANTPTMKIEFKDWDADGKKRTIGDIRYSMMHYHALAPTTGPAGMSEITYDPNTGESLAAHLNIYDWGSKNAINLLKDFLSEITTDVFDDVKNPLPAGCKPGDQVQISPDKVTTKHKNTSLYAKLESYMKQPAEEWAATRSADFYKNMRALLPDLRFAAPWYNSFVYASESSETKKRFFEMVQKDRLFADMMRAIDRGESPFGSNNVLTKGSIEAGVAHVKQVKELVKNHFALRSMKRALQKHIRLDVVNPWELGPATAKSTRRCKADGKWETVDEWAERIHSTWWKSTATHELGHNLGLRHNFYGSLDAPHFAPTGMKDKDGKPILDTTSSIMDYQDWLTEGADTSLFKPYDQMAFKWIYGEVKPDAKEAWLYCDDQHTDLSPFCTWHDTGTTPSQIIKNIVDRYEWQYKFRNFRAYRKFWSTTSYANNMLYTLYPMRRFLNLWALNWYNSGIKNDLILLKALDPKTCDEYCFTLITDEFNDEMGRANRLTVNFYKAILQQSSGERSYATKFDNLYGDVTQQGIIMDKYFAMLLHLGIWEVGDYDQNLYAYLSYHESSFGNSLFYSDAQDVTDSMIGGQYDVYPWFKPLAVMVFAQDTHDVMFGDKSKQKWIEMRRYDRVQDMADVFGFDPRVEALKVDNPYQTFKDKTGNTWVYYYLADRNQHLVANKNTNPAAFKVLWDQNESLNVKKYDWVDDYEIKYYLDFYQYFN
jgi:hypothetical protein